MNEPSSRTPEGVPHRCTVCGTEFRISVALAGHACCPNCNTLAWPVGEDSIGSASITSETTRPRVKEIRLRPSFEQADFDRNAKRAVQFLRKNHDVRIAVLIRGRGPDHQEHAQAMLQRFLGSLVPENAIMKTPAKVDGRRITCTLATE